MPDSDPPPLLLTRDEVAKRLGVSARTIQRLEHDGVLPAVRIRGAVRYRPADVEAALDAFIAAYRGSATLAPTRG